MTSAGTWFENTSHDTFFDHRNKQRLQLDHFMISQKLQKQVTNCKRTRPIISSDHLPVKIKLRAVKKILPKQNLSEIEFKIRWRVNQRKRKRSLLPMNSFASKESVLALLLNEFFVIDRAMIPE